MTPAEQVGQAAMSAIVQKDAEIESLRQQLSEVTRIYNTVIYHAISLGSEGVYFLQCWGEGDWAGCRGFDFTDSLCMEDMK